MITRPALSIEHPRPLLPHRIADLGAFWHAGLGVRGNVASWTDQTHRRQVLSEATNQPTRVSNDGRLVIRFDGVNDVLEGALTFPSSNVYTLCVAYEHPATPVAHEIIVESGDADATLSSGMHIYQNDTARFVRVIEAWPTPIRNIVPGASLDTNAHVWTAMNRVANAQGWIDGSSIGIDSDPASLTIGDQIRFSVAMNLAGGQPSEVDIYAIAYYFRDLAVDERVELERYMGRLAGLALHG